MKRLDKLIIGAFLGPFFLTFSVVLFIFLTQYLLKYRDDLLGKDLGLPLFSELVFYFSMNMVPNALPLAVLISCLMTFGNLGEHHELTAIKSSGISMIRALVPIFLITLGLSVSLFYFNNIIVPKANLKAYSLLYDIKEKKPALNIKEGVFYKDLPGYSVKATKKFPDGKSLKGVMIYNHTTGRGNTDLVVADSGTMYTFYNKKFLALELYRGESYTEYLNNGSTIYPTKFIRNKFLKSKMVFSLASFDLKKTQQELFASNKYMKNIRQLDNDVDSLRKEYKNVSSELYKNVQPFYTYQFKHYGKKIDSIPSINIHEKTSAILPHEKNLILGRAANQARSIKSFTAGHIDRLNFIRREGNAFEIEKHRKYVQSVACLIMFLIGAPLGAIIKKGGLGIPIFVGIVFFIIFYVLSMIGEKWAKESLIIVPFGMWMSNVILLPMGLFFLRQAKNDSRLFEIDVYSGFFRKIRIFFEKIFKKRV